jgi:hypothetical protein
VNAAMTYHGVFTSVSAMSAAIKKITQKRGELIFSWLDGDGVIVDVIVQW